MSLRANLEVVQCNIARAAASVNRDPQEIALIAVTKTVPVSTIQAAQQLGINTLGENRVQELLSKIDHVNGVNWHFIGHLQSNKVKYIVDRVNLIHSLDRLSLAKELQKRANQKGIQVEVLVEVNVAGEETKFGLDCQEVEDFCRELTAYNRIAVKGLMTVAPYVDNPEEVREVFRRLRELRDYLGRISVKAGWSNITMRELSMGMSNDYQVAIQEGATMIRIGTALFGERSQ